MDRNTKGQYQSNQYHGASQQHQGNNAPYTWAQNGMTPMYRGQTPSSAHPPRPTDGNMYYNQAQPSHPPAPPNTGIANHSYPTPQSFPPSGPPPPQYGQQMNNTVNPWGHYNQTQSYNNVAATNTPAPAPAGQPYNQYMYPPPPPPPSAVNNMSNPSSGQAMPFAPPPVHPYYQMQQAPPPNYYYSQNQMYPTAVPPPPLPPLPPSAKPETSSNSDSSRIRESSSPVASDSKPTKSSTSASSVKASNSKKDTKAPPPPVVEEKEKEEKETKKAVPIMVGKRRGGRVLPTGVVKKQKVEDDGKKGKSDAWSQYMAEVRRYKDQSCTEERQNRPLVK
ncbi:unnamed protein product [Orchesella dallaii]|uniref:Uncharacterized protein n=1 Tax=Orchesella dallaii TaxID=48710 RepID=A0ABP1PWC4_9HEXA